MRKIIKQVATVAGSLYLGGMVVKDSIEFFVPDFNSKKTWDTKVKSRFFGFVLASAFTFVILNELPIPDGFVPENKIPGLVILGATTEGIGSAFSETAAMQRPY